MRTSRLAVKPGTAVPHGCKAVAARMAHWMECHQDGTSRMPPAIWVKIGRFHL